jgi:hypothetical protein
MANLEWVGQAGAVRAVSSRTRAVGNRGNVETAATKTTADPETGPWANNHLSTSLDLLDWASQIGTP